MQSIESLWPIAAGACCLLLAAWKQYTVERVPNGMIGLFLLCGVVTAGCATADLLPTLNGGISTALAGLFVGGGVLLPVYAYRGLGAGCVKAQAVFGVWVGSALPLTECLETMFVTTFAAALLTLAAGYLWWFRQTEQARERYLFPAQVTLSLGSLAALTGMWALS